MNSYSVIENKTLKEKYYKTKLKNGFVITVIPKKTATMHAMVCCDFGGADIEYEKNGVKYSFPAGTAHFLEHKMFEGENGNDTFLEFDKFGGNANAFTSFESTCYYFSCTDNFFQNLEVLLKSVSSVHCSDASVEKEKKIISREITMYEDLPTSNVTRNLSKALYHAHPTIHAISGTIASISEITKETLFRAYNDFYVPSNLSLCICGDVDLERVLSLTEQYFGADGEPRPKTIFPDEPVRIARESVTQNALVASALYCIGIKCTPYEKNDLASFRRATAMRLAISLAFGRASDFYCQNYEQGLLNERFYAGYTQARKTAHVIISGSGNDYSLVAERAIAELEYRKKVFFTEEQILREKKAAYAESITLFDSHDDLTASLAACAHLEYDEFDAIEILREITAEEIKAALDSIDLTNRAISIIQKG